MAGWFSNRTVRAAGIRSAMVRAVSGTISRSTPCAHQRRHLDRAENSVRVVAEHARPVARLHSRPGEHVVPHGKLVRCNRVDELGDGASERKSYLANPPRSTFARAVAAVSDAALVLVLPACWLATT